MVQTSFVMQVDKITFSLLFKGTIMQVFHAAEVPKGARVLWDNDWWTVADIRRHALTTVDNTVWMILDGYKAYGRDQPLVLIDTPVWVDTSFT